MSELKNHVDGIFKAFIKVGNEKHRLWEIRKLKERIEHSESRCGSCKKWMTQECRFESPRNMVTMNDRKCVDFEMTKWTSSHIEKLNLQIKQLKLTSLP